MHIYFIPLSLLLLLGKVKLVLQKAAFVSIFSNSFELEGSSNSQHLESMSIRNNAVVFPPLLHISAALFRRPISLHHLTFLNHFLFYAFVVSAEDFAKELIFLQQKIITITSPKGLSLSISVKCMIVQQTVL